MRNAQILRGRNTEFINDNFIYLLATRKTTIYKLMWWLYTVRYDTMYYFDVVVCSSSDFTSGALQF